MKIISIVLIVVMLFSPSCLAETVSPDLFEFRSGVRWGMRKNEVIALEGNDYTDYDSELYYMDVRVSNCTGFLSYSFVNDSLTLISYNISEYSKRDYQNLLSAYRAKYGDETETNIYEFAELLKIQLPGEPEVDEFYPNPKYLKWNLSDGTAILMYWIGEIHNIEGY